MPSECRILVVGVGRWGKNFLDKLSSLGVRGVEYLTINTDGISIFSHRNEPFVAEKISLGHSLDNPPSIDKEAAMMSVNSLDELLPDTSIVFVAAETSVGAEAAKLAELAKKNGALVIGVVTSPCRDGKAGFTHPQEGLDEVRRVAHTTIIVDDKPTASSHRDQGGLTSTTSDEAVAAMIKGIVETLTLPCTVKLNLADLNVLMAKGDIAIVGMGQSDSPNRAEEAAMEAMSRLSMDIDHDDVEGALIHVCGGPDTSLGEVVKAAECVTEMIGDKAMVVCGAQVDPNMKNTLRVTTMSTCVQSQRSLGDLHDAEIQLYNMEPFAGPEAPLDLGVELFQMEPRCA